MELRLAYLDERLVLTCIVLSVVAFLPLGEDAIRKARTNASWHCEHSEHLGIGWEPVVQICGKPGAEARLLPLERTLCCVAWLASKAVSKRLQVERQRGRWTAGRCINPT